MKHLILLIIAITIITNVFAQTEQKMTDNSNKLAMLWTSGDPDVAEKMGFMYAYNAKKQGWFDEVVIIVWGPSQKLLSENKMLQDYVEKMREAGVIVEACLYCARMYDVDQDLAEMDVDVKGMGIPLTKYLKEGWKVITI